MKANRTPLPAALSALTAAAALAALIASCASPPPPPPPRPAPRPQPTYTPPPPPRAQPSDWRDRPFTPGNWRWIRTEGASSARFAEGPSGAELEFRCDREAGTVRLIRSGSIGGPAAPLTVTTTSTARTVSAQLRAGGRPAVVATLASRDALLDAIIFSRGRFAVEVPGLAPIYAPTWPEIARVVEDCR